MISLEVSLEKARAFLSRAFYTLQPCWRCHQCQILALALTLSKTEDFGRFLLVLS